MGKSFSGQRLGLRNWRKLFKIKDPNQVLSFTWSVGICHTYKPKLRKLKKYLFTGYKTRLNQVQQCCPIITQFKRQGLKRIMSWMEMRCNVGHSETLPQNQQISIPSAMMLLCSIMVCAGQHIKFAIAHIHATRINPQTPRVASEARTPFRSCARAGVWVCKSFRGNGEGTSPALNTAHCASWCFNAVSYPVSFPGNLGNAGLWVI